MPDALPASAPACALHPEGAPSVPCSRCGGFVCASCALTRPSMVCAACMQVQATEERERTIVRRFRQLAVESMAAGLFSSVTLGSVIHHARASAGALPGPWPWLAFAVALLPFAASAVLYVRRDFGLAWIGAYLQAVGSALSFLTAIGPGTGVGVTMAFRSWAVLRHLEALRDGKSSVHPDEAMLAARVQRRLKR